MSRIEKEQLEGCSYKFFLPSVIFIGNKITVLASLNLLPHTIHSTALTHSFQPPQLRSLQQPVFQEDGQIK